MARNRAELENTSGELKRLIPNSSQSSFELDAQDKSVEEEYLRLATVSKRQLSRNPWLQYQSTHLWTEYLLSDTVADLFSDQALLTSLSNDHLLALSKLMLENLPVRRKKGPFQLILTEVLRRNFDWSQFAQDLIQNLLEESELFLESQITEAIIRRYPTVVETYLLDLQWQLSKVKLSFYHLLASSPFLLEKTCLWVKEQYLKYPGNERVTQFASSFFSKMRSTNSLSFLYPIEAQPLILYADLVSVMPPSLREAQEKLILHEYLKLGQNDAKLFQLHFPELSHLFPAF